MIKFNATKQPTEIFTIMELNCDDANLTMAYDDILHNKFSAQLTVIFPFIFQSLTFHFRNKGSSEPSGNMLTLNFIPANGEIEPTIFLVIKNQSTNQVYRYSLQHPRIQIIELTESLVRLNALGKIINSMLSNEQQADLITEVLMDLNDVICQHTTKPQTKVTAEKHANAILQGVIDSFNTTIELMNVKITEERMKHRSVTTSTAAITNRLKDTTNPIYDEAETLTQSSSLTSLKQIATASRQELTAISSSRYSLHPADEPSSADTSNRTDVVQAGPK